MKRILGVIAFVSLLACAPAAFATSTAALAPNCLQLFDPDTGGLLVGGKVQVYIAGTTTPTSAYTDATGTVALANPAIADGSGVICMWLDPAVSVKLVIKDSSDAVIRTLDGINTPAAGVFTTLTVTGAVTFSSTVTAANFVSTVATGTQPYAATSTTKNTNLNADLLDGNDWATPAALGSVTPAAVSATTLNASGTAVINGATTLASTLAVTGAVTANANVTVQTANGAQWIQGQTSELLTIAAAATTDTSANLLPVNSIIEAIVCTVNTTIPTAATFTVGDATTPARFATGVGVAAGSTAVGTLHWSGAVTTSAAGPTQPGAAKIRITPNLTPGTATGVVRITVFYRQFVPPIS